MSLKVNLDTLKLKPENAEVIVEGILAGNRQFANMRMGEQEYLVVSSGLSWARSNYIDSGVFHEYDNLSLGDFSQEIATAGKNWKYVQFAVENRALIVVRPERGQESRYRGTSKNVFSNTPLGKLSERNRAFFNETDANNDIGKQMELGITTEFGEALDKLADDQNFKLNQFFVVTYAIEGQNVAAVKMYMPNPYSKGFQLIEDLTKYIDFSSNEYQLTQSEIEKIGQDTEFPDAGYYAFSVEEGSEQSVQ